MRFTRSVILKLRVSMMSHVGQNAPTYCTGLGKILLAYLPPARVKEILKTEKMVRYTDRTITRRADLTRELAAIRERGYAMDNEEHELGVRCLAAPVYDNCDNVCAAISISVPSVRLTDDEIPRYREIVMTADAEISRRLGYRGEVQVTSAELGYLEFLDKHTYPYSERALQLRPVVASVPGFSRVANVAVIWGEGTMMPRIRRFPAHIHRCLSLLSFPARL